MTVSPTRSQDSERPPTAGNNGVQEDNKSQCALPPTLFKLPNLNGSKPPAAIMMPVDTAASAEPERPISPEPQPTAPAPLELATANSPELAPPTATKQEPTKEEPAKVESSLPSATPSPAPAAVPTAGESSLPSMPIARSANPPADAKPAGRTWMEKIGSHALVLVMLLIVIAAALFTGKQSTDPSDFDNSIAENASVELDFDIGSQVQLPIPDHDHGSTTGVAINTSTAADLAISELPEIAQQSPDAHSHDSLEHVAKIEVPPVTPSATVDLKIPEATVEVAKTVDQINAELMAAATPRIDTNSFVDGSTSIEATAVSNRTGTEEALAVPTLEDLESNADIPAPAAITNGPRYSRTPFGITDWSGVLQELEALEAATANASSASVPLTQPSN